MNRSQSARRTLCGSTWAPRTAFHIWMRRASCFCSPLVLRGVRCFSYAAKMSSRVALPVRSASSPRASLAACSSAHTFARSWSECLRDFRTQFLVAGSRRDRRSLRPAFVPLP